MSTPKLDSGQKNLLRLIRQGQKADGWTPVSEALSTLVSELPEALARFEKLETGGRVKLTEEGEAVVNAMEWL